MMRKKKSKTKSLPEAVKCWKTHGCRKRRRIWNVNIIQSPKRDCRHSEFTRYCHREPGDHERNDVLSQPRIFFTVRSASPPSLLPGSAQYHWSTANSKLANQQGSKLIIQLTVEKLKFFIKGKWNTVNLCFNGAFPHVAFTLLVLWLCCEAVTQPKNDRSFTDLKIRQVLSFFFPLHDDFSSYNYCNSLIMEDNMAGKQARKKVW